MLPSLLGPMFIKRFPPQLKMTIVIIIVIIVVIVINIINIISSDMIMNRD